MTRSELPIEYHLTTEQIEELRLLAIDDCVLWSIEPCKYELVDNPWEEYDHSGMLEEVPISEEEILEMTIGEWLELYNGEKHASYMSGCGWFYDSYRDDVDYGLRSLSYEWFRELMGEDAIDDLDSELYDYWNPIEIGIIESISSMTILEARELRYDIIMFEHNNLTTETKT